MAADKWDVSRVQPLVRVGQCVWADYTPLTGQWHSFRNTPGSQRGESPPTLAVRLTFGHFQRRAARSAAAQFGQEVGHAEEDPHHQEVGAEGQQGQGVHEAGVQPEVTHWQQAAQVLLDHPLPRANAAEPRGREEEEEEKEEEVVVWSSKQGRGKEGGKEGEIKIRRGTEEEGEEIRRKLQEGRRKGEGGGQNKQIECECTQVRRQINTWPKKKKKNQSDSEEATSTMTGGILDQNKSNNIKATTNGRTE